MSTMYVQGYLQGSENGRVVTIAVFPPSIILIVGLGYGRQLYFHCLFTSAFENPPLNSKLLGNTDCLHWIWAVKKNDSFSFYLTIAVLLIIYILMLLIKVCYYYMLMPTKYHWNISFQKKLPSKYVVKNARSETHFVWQKLFSNDFQGFVK